MSSILIGGILFGQECHCQNVRKRFWPRRDSNTQPSDLESDALPLRHGVNLCQVGPGFPMVKLQTKWSGKCNLQGQKTKRKPRKSQIISPNFSQSLNTLKKQISATSRHSSSTLKLEKIELEGGRCDQILKLQRFRTNGMGLEKIQKGEGPTEIWTRIAGFKVQSANHYTIGPYFINGRHQPLQQKQGCRMMQNMDVSCRVRTGDLVRVRHTW